MFLKDNLNHLLEQAKPEASPYTLESLEAWLVKQDPAGRYDWDDCKGACLISIYAAGHGANLSQHLCYTAAANRFIDNIGNDTAENIACAKPWTMGDALLRTRAAIAAKQVR